MKRTFFAIALTLVCALLFANAAQAQILTPQGRLTLASGTPVLTSDVVDAQTLYYTPYVGNSLPVSNGTSLSNESFSELSLVITDVVDPETMADVYAIYVSGAFQLCVVTQWANTSSRTTEGTLTQLQGIWVNANTITNACDSATENYTVPAKEGIYLGSFYSSPHPNDDAVGLTVNLQPTPTAGGTNSLIGIWNAYNRVPIVSIESDSNGTTGSWTYGTAGWRNADGAEGNTANSIMFIDGLKQSAFTAQYQVIGTVTTPSTPSYTSIGINNATPAASGAAVFADTARSSTPSLLNSPPLLGLYSVEALEYAGSSTTFGLGIMALTLQISM